MEKLKPELLLWSYFVYQTYSSSRYWLIHSIYRLIFITFTGTRIGITFHWRNFLLCPLASSQRDSSSFLCFIVFYFPLGYFLPLPHLWMSRHIDLFPPSLFLYWVACSANSSPLLIRLLLFLWALSLLQAIDLIPPRKNCSLIFYHEIRRFHDLLSR